MRLWLLVALLIAADAQQPAQPAAAPPQTFRSGAQLVEVDVRVLKDGRFVSDLTAADFQITEDGVPQKIESVVLIGSAPSASAPGTEHSAPSTEHSALSTALTRQTWLFVFDTNHLTAGPFQRAREAAGKFIAERFREGDIGGVVVDGKMVNNRLTSQRAELRAAVDASKMPGELRSRQLDQRELPRLQDEFEAFRIVNNDQEAIRVAARRLCDDDPDACKRTPPDVQVMEKARRMVDAYRLATTHTLSTINALCNGLAKLPGAKTIVFFSEGFVIQQMESDLRLAVARAATAGAHFYTIDARGLNKGVGSQIIDQPLATSNFNSGATFDGQADGINSLAVDTGGFAIRNENNFGLALDQIQEDTGIYYVVAYAPANATFDGKYRAIGVKVSRPNVKVRARRGYLALDPATLLTPKPIAASRPAPTATLPGVPLSTGAIALPEDIDIVPPSVTGRTDAGKMVDALKASASGHLRPGGSSADSTSVMTHADAGWAAYERGDVEAAARELGTAAAAPDARPWVVYALGLSQFALRQHHDAAISWERVRRDVPEFEPVYFNLADAYGLQHDETAALKVLRDAEARWPNDAEVPNAIGVIQVRRGALDAAIESFEKATRVQPGDALGYFNLGRTLQMRMLKSVRYDRQSEKWIGGEDDRKRAIAGFEAYLRLGGPYERQAREALSVLNWK